MGASVHDVHRRSDGGNGSGRVLMAVWQQLRWSPMKALGRYGSHLLESTGPDRSPRSRIATPVVAGESGENSSTAAVERSTDVVQRTPAADQRGRGVRCCQRIAPSIRVRGSIASTRTIAGGATTSSAGIPSIWEQARGSLDGTAARGPGTTGAGAPGRDADTLQLTWVRGANIHLSGWIRKRGVRGIGFGRPRLTS